MSDKKYPASILAGLIGGSVASFVKWGTEIPLPPRTPNRATPPIEMLESMGINAKALVYQYSDHFVNYGSALTHHGFSVVFAVLYCILAQSFPRIALWQGAAFGLIVTLVFHGLVLPTFGWAPAITQLPFDELFSETFGHVLWAWVIEIFRQHFVHSSNLTLEHKPR